MSLLGLLALGAVMLGPWLAQSVVGGGVETGPVAVGFENPDGSLMEVSESVNEKLRARGLPAIEEQPTALPSSE